MSRLFLCVRPPEHVRAAITGVLDGYDLAEGTWRRVPVEQWHVTLRFMGEADPGDVLRALADVELPSRSALPGGHLVAFGGVLALAVEGLDELAAAVRVPTATIGEPPGPRPFRGHLSVARRRRRSGATGGEPPVPVRADPLPAVPAWRPSVLEVVASVTHAAGVRHEVLGRFDIGGGDDPGGNA